MKAILLTQGQILQFNVGLPTPVWHLFSMMKLIHSSLGGGGGG
uniref:Pco130820 n=1 Tax=Arundo donax TaxID=35708 RepID=A0A0A9FBG8_ARUDO